MGRRNNAFFPLIAFPPLFFCFDASYITICFTWQYKRRSMVFGFFYLPLAGAHRILWYNLCIGSQTGRLYQLIQAKVVLLTMSSQIGPSVDFLAYAPLVILATLKLYWFWVHTRLWWALISDTQVLSTNLVCVWVIDISNYFRLDTDYSNKLLCILILGCDMSLDFGVI